MASPNATGIPGGATPPRWRPAALVIYLLGALALAPCAPAAPLEVYGRLPRIEDVALSPDGSRIAFVKTEENTRLAVVMSVADRTMMRGVRVADAKLRGLEWADNDHLLILSSLTTVPRGFTGYTWEWFQAQVYDVRNGSNFEVPRRDAFNNVDVMNAIIGPVMVRHLNNHTVLFVPGLQLTGDLLPALIRVDLDTQASTIVRVGKSGTLGWMVDEAGEVQAEETYVEKDHRWCIYLRRGSHLEEVASGHEDIEIPELLGWGPTADTLLLWMIENGNPVWKLLSLNNGSIGPAIAGTELLSETIEHPLTHRLIGGVHYDDSRQYVFFERELRDSWNSIVHTFPGEHVLFESASADFRKVIVRLEGPKHGLSYELVDLDAHRATPLGDVYEGVTQPLGVRRVNYTAGDGLTIPAYLTLPRGKAPKNLALIVLPHGGPAARDSADFDWWSQALADQGYAVLQPNYRGSALDRQFLEAGFGQWGRKMQTDLSDGVRYLAKEGIADPTRVCIVGASYGGYAALAGAALDPGVYRCAVAVAGIADVRRMLDWINSRHWSKHNRAQRYWDRFMGVSGPADPAVEAISPIRHLNAITVPMLLIHGRDDTVVPFEQSQLMYDALRGAKKDVQLVKLKAEDHWLSRSGTRLQMLEVSVAFLREHNPPD
jgi:esterase/lipase